MLQVRTSGLSASIRHAYHYHFVSKTKITALPFISIFGAADIICLISNAGCKFVGICQVTGRHACFKINFFYSQEALLVSSLSHELAM